jgi:hypothetical protein
MALLGVAEEQQDVPGHVPQRTSSMMATATRAWGGKVKEEDDPLIIKTVEDLDNSDVLVELARMATQASTRVATQTTGTPATNWGASMGPLPPPPDAMATEPPTTPAPSIMMAELLADLSALGVSLQARHIYKDNKRDCRVCWVNLLLLRLHLAFHSALRVK